MPRLPESEIDKITSLLKEGKPLPEDYKEDLIQQLEQLKRSLLFDTKKEYELLYADKEREVDILADWWRRGRVEITSSIFAAGLYPVVTV